MIAVPSTASHFLDILISTFLYIAVLLRNVFLPSENGVMTDYNLSCFNFVS